MPTTLSHFLGEHEGLVAKFIRSAEGLCGYPSEDVRLLAEIAANVKDKISQLGLDPLDTTGKELYYTLRAKAQKDSQAFAKICGFDNPNNATDQLIEVFNHTNKSSTVYVLKKNVAKNLLRSTPPRQLMKQLKYRSVDSMTKREEVSVLFSLVFHVESSLWKAKLNKSLKKLTANDFEERKLELIKLPTKFSKLEPKDLTICYLLGSLFLRSPGRFSTDALSSGLGLLEAANKIKAWSHSTKLKQLSPEFGKYVAENANILPTNSKFFGVLPINLFRLENQRSVAEKLADISLPLAWWRNNDFLASRGKSQPISLNLRDILSDQSQNANITARSTAGFREALRHKLVERYLAHPSFRASILNELSPEQAMISEDSLIETEPQYLAEVA